MKKIKVSLLLCLLAVSSHQTVFAADVNVTTNLFNESLELFFLNDFDINRPASGPPFFSVMLEKIGPEPEVGTRLTMFVSSQDRGLLLEAETDCFEITSANPIINVTSNQLFTNAPPYNFVSSNVSDAVDELLDDILRTGRLPTDIYTFRITAQVSASCDQPGGIPSGDDDFEIRVTNPSRLDMITPGGPAGRLEDCPTVYTNLPQFRWESNFTKFRFIAARLRTGDDPESALNQEPRFTRLFVLAGTGELNDLADLGIPGRGEVLTSLSYQYPPSGESLLLNPGDVIVWRVIGLVETSAGLRQIESEIFCFRVADLEQIGSGREQYDFILRNLLGSDFDVLFGENGEFQGFRPLGMRLDGQPVTPTEVMPNLDQMRQNYQGFRIE